MNLFKKVSLIVFSLLFSSLFAHAQLLEMTNQKLQENIAKGIQVIDIRTAGEWDSTGVVPSSHKITFFDERGNYDLNEWMSKFQKVVKNKQQPFVLICRSANRTATVGKFLSENLKYENVYHLKGGIKSWMADKRETVK